MDENENTVLEQTSQKRTPELQSLQTSQVLQSAASVANGSQANISLANQRVSSPTRSDQGSKGASSLKSSLRAPSPERNFDNVSVLKGTQSYDIQNSSIRGVQEDNVKGMKSPSLKGAVSPNAKGTKSPSLKSAKAPSIKDEKKHSIKEDAQDVLSKIESVIQESKSPPVSNNIGKIEQMSKILTEEANALRASIKSLSMDLARTKDDLAAHRENVDFPYHLFLLELIINKIQMKCDCFDFADCNNLVIVASFLGKQPIAVYDSISNGKITNFNKLNVGKSILFAMTYEKICNIKEFEIHLEMTKQPPCTHCVTKLAETRMDYTNEFVSLREELCQQWTKESPNDNIICTTSTELMRNKFYLSCGDSENQEAIGLIEVSVRMSFLGKEITTAFSKSPNPRGTSMLMKENNGMTMYSCQKVEMDDGGKVVLDQDVMRKKENVRRGRPLPDQYDSGSGSQISQSSALVPYSRKERKPRNNQRSYYPKNNDFSDKYDEISTKMNTNELRIKVPKSTRVDRVSEYEKVSEMCSCEETPYNTGGEQIQFEFPKENNCYPGKQHDKLTQNLKYTYQGCNRNCEKKDRKIVNVTPTNCPVPVEMGKELHPHKDVFILKIGKKLESKDKKTELEIELVTPKLPTSAPAPQTDISQQCSSNALNKKLGKKKGKKGAKKKGGKSKGKKKK